MLKFCPGARRKEFTVNPGSKAAQKGVREGDVISSINGQPTKTLSNSDAHALLRNAGQSLRLGLNEDCGGSPKRRSYKMATSQSSSGSIQSDAYRNESTKRASAPGGGDGGGPSKESGEESKQPEKDGATSRRRGCRGRRGDGPTSSPAAEDVLRHPLDAAAAADCWVQEEEAGAGGVQRPRKARKGVRERRKARLRAAGLSGGEASGGEGRSGPDDERPSASDATGPEGEGTSNEGSTLRGEVSSHSKQDSSEAVSKQLPERVPSLESSDEIIPRAEERVCILETRVPFSDGAAKDDDASVVVAKSSSETPTSNDTCDLGGREDATQGSGVQSKALKSSETPMNSSVAAMNFSSESVKATSEAASLPSVPSIENNAIEPSVTKVEGRVSGRRSRRQKIAGDESKETSTNSSSTNIQTKASGRSSPIETADMRPDAEEMATRNAAESDGFRDSKKVVENEGECWREVGRGGKEIRRDKKGEVAGKEVEEEVRSSKEAEGSGGEGSKVAERGREGGRRRRRRGGGEGVVTIAPAVACQLSEETCAPEREGVVAEGDPRTDAVGRGEASETGRSDASSSSASRASSETKKFENLGGNNRKGALASATVRIPRFGNVEETGGGSAEEGKSEEVGLASSSASETKQVEKSGGKRKETLASATKENPKPGNVEEPVCQAVEEKGKSEEVGFTRVSHRRRRRDVNCDVSGSKSSVVPQTAVVECEKNEPTGSSGCGTGSGCRGECGEKLIESTPSCNVDSSGEKSVCNTLESKVSHPCERSEEFASQSQVVCHSEAVVEVLEDQKFESLSQSEFDSGVRRKEEVGEGNENLNAKENEVDGERRDLVDPLVLRDPKKSDEDGSFERYSGSQLGGEKDPVGKVSIGGGEVAPSDRFNRIVERVARCEILCTEWKTVEEFCSSDCKDMSTEFEIVSVARKASSHVTATAVTLLPPQEGSSKEEDLIPTSVEEVIVETTNQERKEKEGEESKDSIRLENTLELEATVGDGVESVFQCGNSANECVKNSSSEFVSSKKDFLNTTTTEVIKKSTDEGDFPNDVKCPLTNEEGSKKTAKEGVEAIEKSSGRLVNDLESGDSGRTEDLTSERILCLQGDAACDTTSVDFAHQVIVSCDSPSGGAVHEAQNPPCSSDAALADPLGDDETAPSRSPVSPFPLPPLPPPPFSPPSSRSSPVPFSDPSAIHPPFSGILHSHRESHPVTDLPHLSSLPSSPVPCSTPPPASFDPEENPEEKPTPAPLRLSLPLPPEALPENESSEEGVLNFDTHCRSPPDHSSHSPYFMGEVSTTPPLPRCARTPTPPVSPSPEESSVNIRVDSSLDENSHGAFLKFTSPPGDEDRSKSSAESGEAAIQTEEKDPKVLSGDSLSLEGTPERLPEMPEEAYIRRILRSMNIEEGEFRSRVISSKSDAPSPSKNSRRRRAERRAGTFPPGSSRKPLEVIVEEEKHSGSGEESGGNSGRIATNSSRRRKRRMRRESEGSSGKEVKTPEESSGEEGEYFPRVIEGLVQKVTEPPDAPAMQGPAEVVVIEEVEDAEEGGEWSEGWREEEFVEGEEEAASVEDKGVANVVTAEESEAVEPPQQPQLTRRMSRELFIIPESDEEREEREQAVEGGVVERGGGVEAGKPAPDLDAVSPEAAVTERVQEEERGGDASECKENGGEEGGAGMFCETEGVGLEAVEAAEGGGKGGEGSSIRPPGGGDADESGDLQNKCDARGVAEDKTPAPSTAAPVSESEPQVTIVEVSSLQSECDNVLPDRVKIVVKEPSLEEPRPKSVDKRTPENIISLPETSEAVQEIVQETELEERTGSVNNFQNNQVIPVKEIHQVQLKEQSEVKENTSAQMEPVKGPPKPCDDEETSRPVGSESVPNTCYDVAESMSEDEEMLRSAEAALEAYSAGRESSRSPSTTTSQCTEICRPDQPESLLQMCVKTVSTLPYGMTVLREIWTSTPPVAAERDRRRSSAPSPESRSEGEGKGGAERPPGVEEAMFSRTSPAPSSQCTEPELDHAPPRVQSIPAGAQQDSNPDHWVPIPTMGDVNICLSPKQLEAFVPDPSQAARLLDMHVKFSERRGYHEGERARGAGRRNVEEEERGAASSWAQIHGSPPPPPPAACGVEGGGVEGSRLLPMLLDEEQAVEDSKRSGPADSSRSFAADSPRSLPRNSPRAFGAAALGMGLLPGEMPEGPSSPSSVGSAGDERRLKARALSEWLSLARSDGGGAFSPRSEGSPRSFCSPPPGGEESTEEPPTIRVCDVIRRFEMSAAASGFKAPVPVRHSLYFERKRSDSGQDGPGSNPGGVGESPEAGPTEDNVQKRQFDAEKYRISKQGDIAIEIAGASELSGGGHGKQKRPVSMPPAVTGGEIFRQQMYMEYMHKVAERAERKQHKVIKLTARAGTEVQGQQQQQQQPSAALAPTEELFVSEFMGKVRQRMERVGVAEDEEGGDRVAQAEGSPGGGVSNPGGADDDGQPQFIIEGGLKELPKHLREDTDLLLADDGVWTPSKSVEDLRAQPPSQQQQQHSEPPAPQRESGATSKEGGDSTDDVAPVWVPKSAGPSPVLERKEFRPVNFDANSLTRKKDGQSRALASQSPAPEESFAWQSKESTETSRSVTVTSEHRSFVQSPTSPGSSFTSHLPKAQNPTITLLQKAREGQLPRGAHYLDDKEKMSSKENDSDIMYTVKKEYETEEDKRKRKIVELGPKKFEGIGPTTREGIPIILRSGIKEENQAKWYKKMYESLHCPGKDDEYVTVRYKTRRGRYPYTSAEGYLSEPDPIGYDSDMGYSAKYATLDRRRIKNKDYNFTTSTMPRSKYIPPSTKYGPEVYKNQPGRIEDYEPGHSSIAEKEAKLWWDEVLDIFDGHANQSSPPSKPFMTHALKESGYESDSTLLFKRREENMQSLSPMEQKQAYKTIQMGGEVPLHGLRKPAPERPKESPHKYVESEVTIHYRSPIRAQAKEALPEEELARRQEEAMRRIYQEERRRKYLQELQDMESRRHTDNFTPSQKSPIPLNRYDNFLDDVPSKSKLRDHTPEPKVVARALYNFVGQTSRELSFRRGDIIFVRRQIDKNWYEGEHNAMIGLFPFNYVEIIPYDGIRTIPKRPTEGQARAKYNFVAQTHLELSLIKGELVVLTRQVDNNWFEGRIGNRRGIFPISYVEVLVEPGERPVTPSSKSATMKSLTSPVSSSLLLNGSSVLSNAAHSQQQPYHQQYLGKQQKQYQAPASYSSQKTTTFTSSLGRNPYSSKTRPSAAQKLQIPSVNQTLHIDTHSDPVPYRALYNYKPQNEDELELQEGDTVYVMEKCDDGWYVGSSHRTGYFGTFPGNYVERI